jgi:hypothetical protein
MWKTFQLNPSPLENLGKTLGKALPVENSIFTDAAFSVFFHGFFFLYLIT